MTTEETDPAVVEVEANLGGTSRGEAVGDSKPLLRVVKGDLTPEELAALIAVVAARSAGGTSAKKPQRSEWGHPSRAVRGAHRPGPDAWSRAALPR